MTNSATYLPVDKESDQWYLPSINLFTDLYTVSEKKEYIKLVVVTPWNVNRFSQFFHCKTHQYICSGCDNQRFQHTLNASLHYLVKYIVYSLQKFDNCLSHVKINVITVNNSCCPPNSGEFLVHVHYLLSPVRLSSVCLSVVCNVHAPHSGGSNFRQYFYGIRYLGHPLTTTENFAEIVLGEPLHWGS